MCVTKHVTKTQAHIHTHLVGVLRQLGVVHCRAEVAQRVLRQHAALPGEVRVPLDHVRYRRAVDEEEIDVAPLGLEVAVARSNTRERVYITLSGRFYDQSFIVRCLPLFLREPSNHEMINQ